MGKYVVTASVVVEAESEGQALALVKVAMVALSPDKVFDTWHSEDLVKAMEFWEGQGENTYE